MLTHARLRELLSYDENTGLFTRLIGRSGPHARAGDIAGCNNGQGYVRIYLDGKPYKAHRLAWLYVYGEWPKVEVDHINGERSDNRIINLRDVIRQQNKTNCGNYRNNKSGLKGVSFKTRTGKWVAQIQSHGKKISLGYFETKEAAAVAYQAAAKDIHGEFARAA